MMSLRALSQALDVLLHPRLGPGPLLRVPNLFPQLPEFALELFEPELARQRPREVALLDRPFDIREPHMPRRVADHALQLAGIVAQ